MLGKVIQDSLLCNQSQPDMLAPRNCMSHLHTLIAFWYITYSHRAGKSYIENIGLSILKTDVIVTEDILRQTAEYNKGAY